MAAASSFKKFPKAISFYIRKYYCYVNRTLLLIYLKKIFPYWAIESDIFYFAFNSAFEIYFEGKEKIIYFCFDKKPIFSLFQKTKFWHRNASFFFFFVCETRNKGSPKRKKSLPECQIALYLMIPR